eukprot:scaffold3054_cov129-Cylindrotheca_fusiformis.AAC.9
MIDLSSSSICAASARNSGFLVCNGSANLSRVTLRDDDCFDMLLGSKMPLMFQEVKQAPFLTQ